MSSISPDSGSTNGATSVSITGTNLATINSVKFGTEAATNFTVNSATSISATTPAHVSGAVDVVLSDGMNTATLSSGFTYNAATFTFSPPAGALTAGTVGTAYNATIAASGGTASYTYEVTSGELPVGLDLNSSTGVISGTPTAAESATFTITAKDANAATSPAVYTLVIGVQAPVANAVSETVAANSSANAITLNITGGAAALVAVDTQASHGTATASGTTITYTPTAGYSGTDSFTYTATNATGTSSPATVSITVSAPTSFTFSPPAGALTGGTVGTAYNVTIAASGGTASYTYEVTSGELPAGLDLNSSTGVISGTPTTAENASFTITAKDANTAQDLAAYTLVIGVQAPVANAVSKTVAANSSANAITLNITGGAAASVAVDTQASHGTATASGTAITYTPTAGYSGTDSFTYTATNATGTSSPATVSITVSAPTSFTFSPPRGALTAGTVGTAYNVTIAASGGTASYTYEVTLGELPAGLDLNSSTGVISGTPIAAENASFTITAKDANTAQDSAAYTLVIGVQAPVANAVSETVAANSSANAITLNITGGAAASVTVDTQASHGTATASGTAITYTPTAGYSGTDSFAYTATNATGTSSPATVSITVSPPTSFTFSPPRGALTAGTVGTAYNVTIAASGGTASYTYEVTLGELPAGLDLNSSTGVISGTPTAAENASFTITAKDANAATSPAVYTLVIGVQAPMANAVSETVAANSSANTITLDITGGAAALVAVDTQASHGTATASGTTITYTPTAGYSGTDSFTYTATNATGTSSPATVSITVSAPTSFTFSPPRGALTAGTVGTAYNETIAASGGTASYTYEVTSGELPAGLDLNSSTGVISGTPTVAESATFTITAKDANTAQDSAAYTLSVVIATAEDLVLSPSEGNLTDAMAGETYNQQITVSGGTAPFAFNVISGTLPDGLTLSTSGLLSGTLADNTQNDYVFEVQVRDAQNMIGKARYNLTVKEQSVQVVSQTITVEAGSSPPDTRLDKNATGGPFDSGELVSVVPSNAGRAVLTMGDYAQSGPVSPVGWYLKFTPTPGFSGPVVITFSLTSGLGSSTGTVTYNLGYNPAEVATEIDGLVRDFVRSRQSMISSAINVPGLLERRNAENANEPVTTRISPSSNGMTIGFSTSFAQIEAYRNGAGDASGQSLGGISSSPFNVWLSGAFLMHNRDDDDDRRWGSFGMLSAGADYLITDKALVGLSFHLDRMTDPTDADAKLTGNGWLVGPYSSLEIGKGVYWDTSILYGGSANDIDTAFWDGTFDTKRWMADTAIKGQWRLDEVTVLTPKLRAVYLSEQVDDYTVSNAAGDELTLDGFTSEQLRVSLGAEVARKFTLSNDTTLTPKIGLTGGFAGLDGSGAFGTVSTGISLATPDDWNLDFSLLFNVEGDGDRYGGARARMSKRF
ncbi:beta strand repeat-containing protein [Agrobacterium vaccinii]|uniref:beta strand repeat-containing protein n=1 Tax=Agrobacterium vaccinii TaxID=2735528 RepID=UPI001E5247DF|nr:putative Ig domain-containing protein [Agrobacterium vaccinii]